MKLGAPATGDDFRGRTRELQDLWRLVENDHLTLPGARRLGKTSILQRLVAQSAEKGVYAGWIDVSAIDSPEALLKRLEQEFPENTIASFVKAQAAKATDWLNRIRKVELQTPEWLGGGGAGIDMQAAHVPKWTDTAHALQHRLHTQPLLILLDEFPVMLQRLLAQDKTQAEQLLTMLRIWRQTGHWRFVFTGSIGLAALLERHGLAVHMNDCYEYRLGPFSPKDASDLWRHFSTTRGWHSPDKVTQYALQRLGWASPFYLNLLLDETLKAANIRAEETTLISQTLLSSDADTAYENLLVARSRFHHWEKRLRDALQEPELGTCLHLLNHLAKKDGGLTLAQLSQRLSKQIPDTDQRKPMLSHLLSHLCDEGYVSTPNAQGQVQFLSFLLRDWWRRNH